MRAKSKTTLIYIIVAPQPGSGQEELGGISGRSGVEEGRGRLREKWQDPGQSARVRVHGPRRFLEVEITWTPRARRTCATWWNRFADAGSAPARRRRHRRASTGSTSAGKLTARERIAGLIDPGARFLEIGLLIAYDRYDGPGARRRRGHRASAASKAAPR